MNVASVAIFEPQSLDRREHLLHSGVGVGYDAGGEEEAIDAFRALERDEGSRQLVGLEGGALALDRAGGKAVGSKILVTLQCSAS